VLLVVGYAQSTHALTVCADPNNLPFSNRQEQGFENKLVAILARDLHERVEYVWWAQRRGFARHTVAQLKCDLWPGVASGIETMSTSRPYYRSTYVFATRASRSLAGLTLDDPRLRKLTVGVQLIGYDGINTPPAQALADRGLTQNVRGFMLYGDYRQPNPQAAIVQAVADGSIDVALVWGPVAGYFGRRAAVPLRLEPVRDDVTWKMSYEVSVGVSRSAPGLQQQVNAALAAEESAIAKLLASYHVPLLASSSAVSLAAR
jgi:mxaJ protein